MLRPALSQFVPTTLIEAKALDAFAPAHLSQIINYLKASGLQRGLLINFGAKSLEYKRVIWSAH